MRKKNAEEVKKRKRKNMLMKYFVKLPTILIFLFFVAIALVQSVFLPPKGDMPTVGGSVNTWGTELNLQYNKTYDFLLISHTLNGTLRGGITGNFSNLTATNINVSNNLFIGQSEIEVGNIASFTGLEKAMVFDNLLLHDEGSVAFAFVDETDNKTLLVLQVGEPESGGYWRNSMIISEDYNIINATYLTNCRLMQNMVGLPNRIRCNSTNQGASLFVEGNQQIGGHLYVGGSNKTTEDGLTVEGVAAFILVNNTDLEVFGNIHPKTELIVEQGFLAGEQATLLIETFSDGDIDPFYKREQVGTDANNWDAEITANFCEQGECANANGGDGSADRLMETNISTVNEGAINISFYYGIENFDTGNTDNCSLTVYNNTNSYLLWNYTEAPSAQTDVTATLVERDIPSTLWQNSKVSIQFNMHSNNVNEICYIDTIKVLGNTTTATNINITTFNSRIYLGDGSQSIFWNDTSKVLELPSNTTTISETIVDLIVSGTLQLGSRIISSFDDIVASYQNETTAWKRENTTDYFGGGNGSIARMNVANVGNLNITGNFSVDTSTFFVDEASNLVGIGTINPAYTLTVAGDVNLSGILFVNETTGNVGIGESNPTAELVIKGANTPFIHLIDSTNTVTLGLSASDNDAFVGTATNHPLNIGAWGGHTINILSSGNVGIGTTNPAYTLTVAGDVNISGTLNVTGNTTTDNLFLGFDETDSFIYFYEDGSEIGESLKWDNINDYFYFSDSLTVADILQASTVFGATVYSTGDIYTTGSGDDLWLGTATQSGAKFIAYASGDLIIAGDANIDRGLNATSINTTESAYFATTSGGVSIATTTPIETLTVVGNLSISETNNTLGNVSIIQYNASCAGFRFNNSVDAGGIFSCMP